MNEDHPALGAGLCRLIWLVSLCRQNPELFPAEGNSKQELRDGLNSPLKEYFSLSVKVGLEEASWLTQLPKCS